MTEPFIDPARPEPRFKPFKAWKHMQNLIADKEDTEQVFHIIECLHGKASQRDFEAFLETEHGPRMMRERMYLPPILDDHDTLKKLPAGTVGQTYVSFMEREGLSAAGLVAESEKFRESIPQFDDDMAWYIDRQRDTHDLFHVLSGYGRDALGEATLLGFTHSQHGGFGLRFIAFMGGRQIEKYAPRGLDIQAVLAEGRANGKAATRIVDQDIEKLLSEPIDAARARMNIKKPVLYKQALRAFNAANISPATVAA